MENLQHTRASGIHPPETARGGKPDETVIIHKRIDEGLAGRDGEYVNDGRIFPAITAEAILSAGHVYHPILALEEPLDLVGQEIIHVLSQRNRLEVSEFLIGKEEIEMIAGHQETSVP